MYVLDFLGAGSGFGHRASGDGMSLVFGIGRIGEDGRVRMDQVDEVDEVDIVDSSHRSLQTMDTTLPVRPLTDLSVRLIATALGCGDPVSAYRPCYSVLDTEPGRALFMVASVALSLRA